MASMHIIAAVVPFQMIFLLADALARRHVEQLCRSSSARYQLCHLRAPGRPFPPQLGIQGARCYDLEKKTLPEETDETNRALKEVAQYANRNSESVHISHLFQLLLSNERTNSAYHYCLPELLVFADALMQRFVRLCVKRAPTEALLESNVLD